MANLKFNLPVSLISLGAMTDVPLIALVGGCFEIDILLFRRHGTPLAGLALIAPAIVEPGKGVLDDLVHQPAP